MFMHKHIFYSLSILVAAALTVGDRSESPVLQPEQDREAYEQFLAAHEFSQTPRMNREQLRELPKQDRPDLAWQQDFLRTMDPNLGYPTQDALIPILASMQGGSQNMSGLPGSSASPWTERGPNNVGGRTRALAYDPNDVTGKKVWAGGVTGGLWFNNDITAAGTSWNSVDDFWDNIAITSIAFDPNNTMTVYVGTGEGWGTGASRGAGIWKSTDGGSNWSFLTASNNYYYVNDLTVRDANGTSELYVATSRHFYQGAFHGDQGLYRSTDGGTTFTQVLPNVTSTSNPYSAADIELGANGRIWVGTRNNSFGQGGGHVLHSDDGTNWTISTNVTGARRVELACAPSDSNVVYAVMEAGLIVDTLIQTTNMGTSWISRNEPVDIDNGIPDTDFSRSQAWYDLILAVDPNDANTVLVGGIDLFMSTDGANNWDHISKWSNNNQLSTLNCALVHADQHAIVFKAGSSTEVIFGNDGGVYYTDDLANAENNSVINSRNTDYNVTQFYACALHPTAGQDFFLGGTQDNGTHRFNTAGMNSTTEVYGGDGAYCFIDQSDPTFQIASYVYNTYELSSNGGTSFTTNLQNDQNSGSFINPADYDNNQDILYSAFSTTSINRIEDVTGTPSVGQITISGMGSMASHFSVSPHTTSSTTLYIGTRNGLILKVTNADGATPTVSDITGNNLPTASVSSIEMAGSEDTLMATYFNYGVTSVWYSDDGGTSWVSKEGNLPNMPVRWGLFNPLNSNEAIVATELGVWSTSNLTSSSPNWVASNSGLANVRVDMLQVRSSDNEVIAATYGRGIFSSGGFNSISGSPPTPAFSASQDTICAGSSINFTDQSTNNPTSWSWTFTGGTPNSSTQQNPTGITYSASGSYDVKLVVTNANGSDSLTLNSLIEVNALPTVTFGAIADFCVNDPAMMLTSGSPTGGAYSGNGVSGVMFDPTTAGVGSHTLVYTFTDANGCSDTAQQTAVVHALPTVTFAALADVCENDSALALTGGSPAGGTYSGTGVSSGNFDPLAAGVGTHTITYSFTDANSCSATATQTITVIALPTPTLAAFTSLCVDAAVIPLTGGVPAGGMYSGPGVVGGTFDPAMSGAGTHTITYSVTTGPGCTGTAVNTITVNPLPTLIFDPLSDLCLASPVDTLTEGSPIGGIYSGAAVTGNIFDPAVAGLGQDTITYTYTDANGCTDSITQTINVITAPVVILDSLDDVCLSDSAFALGNAVPNGGTFSGPGVSNGIFDPSAAGVGTHQIVYDFNAGIGCSGSDTQNIVVHGLPTVTVPKQDSICDGGTAVTLTGGNPAGGFYSGTGVSAGQFDPAVTGLGIHPIQYTFVDSNGCVATDTNTIEVYAFSASIVGLNPGYCINESAVALTGSPAGGTFSGTGVSGSNFDPGAAGLGSVTIVYNYSDANGCAGSDQETVTVNPAPQAPPIMGPTVVQPQQAYFYDVVATNGASYIWSVAGGTVSSTAGNVASITWGAGPTGTITLVEQDPFGCSDTVTLLVEVGFTSVEEALAGDEGFKIYPNPATTELFVLFQAVPGEEMRVMMRAADGSTVREEVFIATNGFEQRRLQLDGLATGMYILQFSSPQKTVFEKVLLR